MCHVNSDLRNYTIERYSHNANIIKICIESAYIKSTFSYTIVHFLSLIEKININVITLQKNSSNMNKQHIKAIILFLFLLLIGRQVTGQQNRFLFDYITNYNGLTHNTVYDICQDEKGFMWFATEIGLNRYDGHYIKQYHYTPDNSRSLPSYTVNSIVYTSDNILFVGTTYGLAAYCPERDDFRHIMYNNEPIGHISSMKQGFGSELLITTEDRGAFIFNYAADSLFELEADDKIFGITIGRDNSYWAFSRYALYKFDIHGRPTATYPVSPQLLASAISYITTDKNGVLWIGTFENGIFTYTPETESFNQLDVCKKTKMYYVRTIEEGENPDEYWIGAESGLYIINVKTNNYTHYTQSFDNRNKTINNNAVYKVCRSKQDIFYIGTYFGGVNIANTRHIGFNAIVPEEKSGYLHGTAIGTIAKAPDDNLWIATEDAGIAIFNRQNYTFHHLLFSPKDPNSISSNNVHALLMDGNTCWVGHFMGGISKVDINTGKAKRYIYEAYKPLSLSNNFVFALHFLSPDSILVGSLSGVDILNKRTETFSRFRENEFADCFIYDIFTAPDGKIWFCTYNKGIYILDNKKSGLMTHYQANDGSGLTSNSIISYCIDSSEQIWIGTRDGGLLKYLPNEKRFKSCSQRMLVDNIVYGIVEDNYGFFWISTNKGISRLNFNDSTAVHFNVKHGLSGNQHNYKSYFKDNDIIYFGSVTGLTWFNPKKILTPEEKPAVYFTNLRISNEIIRPDSTGVLNRQIDFTQHLTLRHNQNSFTLDYASINYFSDDIAYQYYLEGLETTWSPLVERTQANYTNIAPGDYTFHIRAINTINGLVSEERTMLITVKPPFWASWYAYLFYFIVVVGIFYYFYRMYLNRQREKMTLTIEKIEKENLKLLHQHKMNFFTYISHEFKTPLSIIITSVDMLSQKVSAEDSEIRQSIKRSANRLLSLVNQLMEFRKIETEHAVIHNTKGDIIDFTNQIIHIYRPLLEKKNIQLGIKISYTENEVLFDFDKLEKIITNLLTNAVKYTPQNGTIDFTLKIENNTINFSVKDSGNGMSEKKKEKIFESFYSDGFSNEVVESSGIGLALTASLVKLLKGKISVDSVPGQGSCFNVSLPYTANTIPLSSIDTQPTDIKTEYIIQAENSEVDTTEDSETTTPNKEYTLVIAEDNKDLMTLLHQHFRKKYHVKSLENGQEAWEYMNKKIPDIVITDVMMPVMSGIELCQKIKSDINFCHIPVVMLTAKDSTEDKLEGLQVGADAYIAKPFSIAELEIRLNNILNSQKALRNRLKELAGYEGLELPATNHEQAFVEKMLAIIQNNLENSGLDVQFIADTLGIGRTNLHNKLKKLMNMNTSEFINTVRINKAKELMLQDDELTFAEIAYKVGYKEATYFTRIFKKLSGKTPKEYKQEMLDNKTTK